MKYVLFVCNHNAGRSQMAQAFFNQLAPDDVKAESAGTNPNAEIWPQVIEVMKEVGLDLSGHRPKKLIPEVQLHADWAVTMGCGDACPYVPTHVEEWNIPDPADKALDEIRAIRDEIKVKVSHLLTEYLDDIKADRTAHEKRLARLLPPLITEFEGAKNSEEIRACSDAILSRYDDAPVRSFMLTLVNKQVRECLRDESCKALVSAPS